MKFKTTQKAIKANYTNIICVGYCDLPHLLTYENPIAYTVRREGWGADIYEVNSNTVIVTGYAPFGNIRPDYNIVQRYEQDAKHVCYAHCDWEYSELKSCLGKLIQEFISEVCNEKKN